MDPLIVSFLFGFFLPQVLPTALASLVFALVPPIVLWRRHQSTKASPPQASPPEKTAKLSFAIMTIWAVLYFVAIGVIEGLFSQIPTWVLTVLLLISGLAIADLVVLVRKNVFGIALISVLCLGLSLALFSALPSVQLSSGYPNGIARAGFPLSWYSPSHPNLIDCYGYCPLVTIYNLPKNPIRADYLLFDALVYAFIATLLTEVGVFTRRHVDARRHNVLSATKLQTGSR